jgi:hypothetical protein
MAKMVKSVVWVNTSEQFNSKLVYFRALVSDLPNPAGAFTIVDFTTNERGLVRGLHEVPGAQKSMWQESISITG